MFLRRRRSRFHVREHNRRRNRPSLRRHQRNRRQLLRRQLRPLRRARRSRQQRSRHQRRKHLPRPRCSFRFTRRLNSWRSYDAGRGQRYYIYGATALFADVVTFYRTQLDEKGTLVFKEPPTHMFEIGRFREESMAFPPGVTVKDWAWGGSQGYVNPKPKGSPPRFPTIVMIVPPQPQGSGR